MKCGNCGSKKTRLCPISFGLALGITCALAVLCWFGWMMYGGTMPPMMADKIGELTWSNAGIYALWALLKGFIFGLVLALIYDLIVCCCKSRCCKHDADNCGCACHTKTDIRRDIPERKDVL